jgi:hypothetical protein
MVATKGCIVAQPSAVKLMGGGFCRFWLIICKQPLFVFGIKSQQTPSEITVWPYSKDPQIHCAAVDLSDWPAGGRYALAGFVTVFEITR